MTEQIPLFRGCKCVGNTQLNSSMTSSWYCSRFCHRSFQDFMYRSVPWTLCFSITVYFSLLSLPLSLSLSLQPSDAVQPFITLLSRLLVLLQAIDLSRSQSQYRTSGKPPVSKGVLFTSGKKKVTHFSYTLLVPIFSYF